MGGLTAGPVGGGAGLVRSAFWAWAFWGGGGAWWLGEDVAGGAAISLRWVFGGALTVRRGAVVGQGAQVRRGPPVRLKSVRRERVRGLAGGSEELVKKTSLKFLNLTILPTFAFPKKTVDQCDVKVWGRWDQM
jgi:hypothetical protein